MAKALIDDGKIEELRCFLNANLVQKSDVVELEGEAEKDFFVDIGATLLSSVITGQCIFKNGEKQYGDSDNEIKLWIEAERQKSIKFQTLLIELLNNRGYKDNYPAFYKKADIDRKLFSRIASELNEQLPEKKTLFKLIIGLELSLEESEKLLQTVGYCFNSHKKFDMIIKYCILHQIFDPDAINEYLSAFKEKELFFS